MVNRNNNRELKNFITLIVACKRPVSASLERISINARGLTFAKRILRYMPMYLNRFKVG